LIRLYFRDVTQRREAERRQRELELELELAHQRHLAQIGFYVSGIAHNLRNPLHIISNYIEAVRIKGQAMPELTRMKQATESMISIIDNLLTKLRKESNLRAVEVNLNDLLKSELEFLNADLFFKNEIQKHYSFCEDLPLVKGLYGDFSQALMNIVYNALDALRDCEKKKLEIKTWYLQEKGTICISISDSGKGILEKDQHKIFQPFFSTKKVEGENNLGISSGSGLGLSNSLALLKPYGGEIEFHSKAGEGTTFIISIPSIKQGTH
jgi:signal transduction histidine kinase